MNGIEWVVDCHGCSPDALRDAGVLRAMFDRIVADLGLSVVGEMAWHRFPDTGGMTGMAMLSESHLTCHTFPEFRSMSLNVFCCRPRPQWDFESYLKTHLGATAIDVRSISRNYGPRVVAEGGQ
jgi:S-adenosylmethionine decarboxylase